MLSDGRRRLAAAILIGATALAGCTSGGSGPDHPLPARLTVHIGLFGGPPRPGGGMALSNSPARDENVTAVDTLHRRHTARTDATGVATLQLSPGAYTVFSSYCGTGPHHVVLSAGHTTRVRIECPIP